jgi:hypothetical protein
MRVSSSAEWHPIVKSAERILREASLDNRGILEPPHYREVCLDSRVSKESLKRALVFVNAVVSTLWSQRWPRRDSQSLWKPGKRGTSAKIFGHEVHFALTESARVTMQRSFRRTTKQSLKVYVWNLLML